MLWLQSFDGHDQSTKRLENVLATTLSKVIVTLSAQEIGSTCYGLQNADGNDEHTKRLVDALAITIRQYVLAMDYKWYIAPTVHNILYE